MPNTNLSINEELSGYVARPSGAGPFPGLVVFMEVFGLKHHIQRACDKLAQAGFVAVAPDFYHGVRFEYTDMNGALDQIRRLDDAVVMGDAGATLDWLARQANVDGGRLGAIGFCMGGRLAFLAAARHPDRIGAAVCFYGGGIAPDGEDRFGRVPPVIEAEGIKGSLFLGYGADDQSIGASEHGRIAATLTGLKKRYTLAVYPGAGHAFLCEERQSYAPAAAAKAWPEALEFLHGELGNHGL